MNPLVLSFADGTAFFLGLALAVLVAAVLAFAKPVWLRSALTVAAVAGILLVMASATPIPMWLCGLWIVACTANLIIQFISSGSLRVRCVAAVIALITTLTLAGIEAPHHRLPSVTVTPGTAVFVVGDSISAGTGKDVTWPKMFADQTGLPVTNLAKAGATVEGAIKQAQQIKTQQALVIVEIGGNDILGKTTVPEFTTRLQKLLTDLKAQGHTVVMLELPLFPFMNDFGSVQRAAAAEHNVYLVPKRIFANVLGTPEGTIDGLHLSAKGHQAMSRELGRIIKVQ